MKTALLILSMLIIAAATFLLLFQPFAPKTEAPLQPAAAAAMNKHQTPAETPPGIVVELSGSMAEDPILRERWNSAAEAVQEHMEAFAAAHPSRTVSMALLDTTTLSSIMFNPAARYPGASVPKLYIMLGVYDKLDRLASLQQEIQTRLDALNDKEAFHQETQTNSTAKIDKRHITESIRMMEQHIIRIETYRQEMDRRVFPMIVYSDNWPLHWFRRYFGDDYFQRIPDTLGLVNTSWTSQARHTTAKDITKTLYAIYCKDLFNDDYYNSRMVEMLKQVDRSGLGMKLPDEIVIAQKRGLWNGHFQERHGGGIIYTENGDYIITVMAMSTSATSDPGLISQGSLLLADITALIYERCYK